MEGHIEMDGREEPAMKTQRQHRKKSEDYVHMGCYSQVRTALEKMKTNQEGKTRFEEGLEKMRRKDREIEAQVVTMDEEIEEKMKELGKICKRLIN